MKNRILSRIVFIFLISAIIFISYLWIRNNNSFDWRITYKKGSKEPYGTFVFSELLKSKVGNGKFIDVREDYLKDFQNTKDTDATYVYIDHYFEEDSVHLNALLNFADKGNDVFIGSEGIGYDLTKHFDIDTSVAFSHYSDLSSYEINLNFYDSTLSDSIKYKCGYYIKNKLQKHTWAVIDGNNFSDTLYCFYQLGFVDDGYVNYCYTNYGKGRVFLFTTPLIFTNFSLLKSNNVEYIDKVFASVMTNKVYFDSYRNNENRSRNNSIGKSPLAFILNNFQLRWAWYVLISLGFLFMIFYGKRKQRAIPILLEKKNNTIDFINTIGALFLKVGDNQKIAIYKMRYFLNFIKLKYYLVSNNNSEEFIQKIAIKSNVNYSDIFEIFEQYKLIEIRKGLTKSELNEFHNSLIKFYKNCK